MYLRLPVVNPRTDSGQDALIVQIETDAGISGIGEVDSAPMAVKGLIEGPYSHPLICGLGELLIGEDPLRTEFLWHKMYRQNIYAGRRGVPVGHQGQGPGAAGLETAGRGIPRPHPRLRQRPLRVDPRRDAQPRGALPRPGF